MSSRQILDLISDYILTKSNIETYPELFQLGEGEVELDKIAESFEAALRQL